MENTLYQDKYGDWAGNPNGFKPDFARCCKEVYRSDSGWGRHYQCTKPRGHGPDQAYCKTHDPEAEAKRRRASDVKYWIESNKRRVEWNGPKFLAALQEIADGHNDARGLAKEVIAKFLEGQKEIPSE